MWRALLASMVLLLAVGGSAPAAFGNDCTTYSAGYWATHSVYGPAPEVRADPGWYTTYGPYPPGPAGPDAALFGSGQTWYGVFKTPPKGDAWYILARQWMAAYLNFYNGSGALGTDVLQWLTDGAAYLDQYDGDVSGAPSIPKQSPDRSVALDLARSLEAYNLIAFSD